jgi:phage gpG-like protein
MTAEEIKSKILNDVRVDLREAFDKNFEQKSFFGEPWKTERRNPSAKGSLLLVKGRLRNSIRARVVGDTIVFTSSVPYANIHNEGGEITVTAKMKRFFWAKYYENTKKIKYKKNEKMTKGSIKINEEAMFWRAMALKRPGDKVVIPSRRFIGKNEQVTAMINRVVKENLKEIEKILNPHLKK